ncbi:LysR family transcriptional regulator [Vibrio agarivorans]|uniref:LysR family transcriptional regulator n=1 Tax=Vibrio agarivorans TaxID=153622 RepID=UPI002230BA89|nr:LysR family transcriptional regulator [Vibrio agarivorans]MDN3660125.1 LysR family transcriptional regulator [Vibrio agarivorans]
MISLEQVQTFTHVYEQGSYSAAARAANKERSTIREHILALEDTLGVKLFAIEGRKAIPTKNAEKLIVRSKNLSKHAEDFSHAAMTLYQEPLSKIIIWHDNLIPSRWLSDIISSIQVALPHIEIECAISDRDSAYRAIEEQRCHVALMSAETKRTVTGKLKSYNLGSLTMNGYCHPDSDLAKKGTVILSDLELSPQYLLANSKEADLGYYEIGNQRHAVTSVRLAIELIKNDGWIILSDQEAEPWLSNGELVSVNYRHLTQTHMQAVSVYFGLISEEQREISKAIKIIEKTACHYLL